MKQSTACEATGANTFQQHGGASVEAKSNDLWPSLGSAWIHNGRRDERAEWRLVTFQPLWEVRQSSTPQVPVSVQAVTAGAHVIIRKTFLSFELEYSATMCRKRARSLDAISATRSKI